MSPLAVFRLCQRKLTSVGLTVDPWVRGQYLTAMQLYGVWISSAELAAAEPSIPYRPFPPDDERFQGAAGEHPLQHLSVADVEQLIEALQVRDDEGQSRCMSFGEFATFWAELTKRSPLTDSIAKVMWLFEHFIQARGRCSGEYSSPRRRSASCSSGPLRRTQFRRRMARR